MAHSLRLALATRMAPAARSRAATPESRGAIEPSSASEPAVVVIRSAVSMLSFSRIGSPFSRPEGTSSRSASAAGEMAITDANG